MFLKLTPHLDGLTSCVNFQTTDCPTRPVWIQKKETLPFFLYKSCTQSVIKYDPVDSQLKSEVMVFPARRLPTVIW